MKLPIFVGTGVSSLLPNGLLNGLQSYYKCDTNGSFPDAHGSNTGTISGATFNASGKINGAYDFVGPNDYVDLGSGLDFSGDVTASCWIFIPTLQSAFENIINNQGVSEGFILRISSTNTINWLVGNGSGFVNIGTTAVAGNTWCHLVGTFDDTLNETKLYINGTEVADGIQTSRPVTTRNMTIGNNFAFSQGFTGTIDEAGIWNKALTPTEITALYNGNSGLSYDSFTS